jgi:type IV secretory pathway VirB4 component
MQSKQLAKPKPGPATQKFLDIAEIKDDTVILKDGTLRAVLLISSINFSLKSADEQEAIIQSYMTFLNSIDFPLQVVVQSRQMNIDAYMESLKGRQKETENELLKAQIADYTNFVKELVELGEIMQKFFYIVVPLDPLHDSRAGFLTRVSSVLSPAGMYEMKTKEFLERKELLDRRVGHVQGQLSSMSLKSARLDTQSLIELYYNVYNPDLYGREVLEDLSQIRHER